MKRFTEQDGFIISKTDRNGTIVYANRTFMEISGYGPDELIGKPHNLIRHPDMPKAAFKHLWDTLKTGNEWFGFVKNRTKDGDFYWVFANVTPDRNESGEVVGYFSVRRPITEQLMQVIDNTYAQMRAIEQKDGMDAALQWLTEQARGNGFSSTEEMIVKMYMSGGAA